MKLKKAIFYWILTVCWMIVIFYFSSKPAIISDNQSYWIIEKINQILHVLGLNIQLAAKEWNFTIRKLAHIFEYAVLGILVYMAFINSGANRKTVIYSLITCFSYATLDEIHQLFVPGRIGKIIDIGIDMIGSSIGVFLSLFINPSLKISKNLWCQYSEKMSPKKD